MATKIITNKCPVSFPHVVTKHASQPGAEPKYSVTVLIPKSDTKTLGLIKEAMAEARQKFVEKNGANSLPLNPKHTLYDGDGTRPSGDPFGPECKGHYVITVSCKDKPLVIDKDKQEIMDGSEIYSGCFCRVIMNFFGYNSNGNKGISAALLGIQKLADGEPFGGATRATLADFDDGFEDTESGDDSWI